MYEGLFTTKGSTNGKLSCCSNRDWVFGTEILEDLNWIFRTSSELRDFRGIPYKIQTYVYKQIDKTLCAISMRLVEKCLGLEICQHHAPLQTRKCTCDRVTGGLCKPYMQSEVQRLLYVIDHLRGCNTIAFCEISKFHAHRRLRDMFRVIQRVHDRGGSRVLTFRPKDSLSVLSPMRGLVSHTRGKSSSGRPIILWISRWAGAGNTGVTREDPLTQISSSPPTRFFVDGALSYGFQLIC